MRPPPLPVCALKPLRPYRYEALSDGARVLLQGNHIYGNMRVGIRIESQADPLVVRNSIFNGFHHGVLVCDGGRGTLQVLPRSVQLLHMSFNRH